MADTVDIFFAYAQADEPLRNALEKHLSILKRQGFIMSWHDQKILPSQEWEQETLLHLHKAHLILLLVSSDFLASDYSYGIEFKKAMERHRRGEATVIPVILRPVDWKHGYLEKLQVLPLGGKPVTSWPNQDEGFLSVAEGIRKVVEKMRGSSTILSTRVRDKDLWEEPLQKAPVEIIADRHDKRITSNINKVALLEMMIKYFTVEDLEVLCAFIERALAEDGIEEMVNLGMVGGTGMPAKVLNLITYLNNRRYLAYLVEAVRLLRPGII